MSWAERFLENDGMRYRTAAAVLLARVLELEVAP